VYVLDAMLRANLARAPKPTDAAASDAAERATLAHHVCGGTLESLILCSGCGHRNLNRERVTVIELAVQLDPAAADGGGGISSSISSWVRGAAERVGVVGPSSPGSGTVRQLLFNYTAVEVLDDYKCDG